MQIDLHQRELPNLRKISVDVVEGCVTQNRYRGEEASVRSFKFNPNSIKLREKSKPFVWAQPLGDCKSLADFDISLKYWAEKAHVSDDHVHIVRVDFAFDFYGTRADQIAKQIKIFRSIVAAFALKHHVRHKDQYEGHTIYNRRWKNIKAVHRALSMEAYDRRIKDPDSPATLRLEIRYGEQSKYRPTSIDKLSISEILHMFEDELQGLYTMLPKVENAFNAAISEDDSDDEMGYTIYHSENACEYARHHADRIFTRRQLRKLYADIHSAWAKDGRDATKAQVKNWAKNQLDRHPTVYRVIAPADYKKSIEALLEAMKTYLKNEGVFEKRIKIAESANPVADGLLERFTY